MFSNKKSNRSGLSLSTALFSSNVHGLLIMRLFYRNINLPAIQETLFPTLHERQVGLFA